MFAVFCGQIVAPALLLVALVAFFSPWAELQYNGKTYYTQSGLQCCLGGRTEATIPPDVRQKLDADELKTGVALRDELFAPPVLHFGLIVAVLFVVSLFATLTRLVGLAIRRGSSFSKWVAGPIRSIAVLGGAAAAVYLLSTQFTDGLPFERNIAAAVSQAQETDPDGRAGASTAIGMFGVNKTNAFWVALWATACVPVLILLENAVLLISWLLRRLPEPT